MWFKLVIICVASLANSEAKCIKAAGCSINLNDDAFPEPDPLLLFPNERNDDIEDYESAFVLPEQKSGLLTLSTGAEVRVACPGSSIVASGNEEDIATCVGNNKFTVGSSTRQVDFEDLACDRTPINKAVRKDTCEQGATGVELGFELSDDFYPLVYTCFDEKKLVTLYSKERIVGELSGYESGESSPSFQADDFYPGININDKYTYDSEVDAFTDLLGSSKLATQYLKDHNSYFLARGHFTPRADFVFGSHTRATFHFINVAPQWQVFNGGVWNNLEMAVRDYVIETGVDLIGYTGPWGILSYPDINGNPTEIYLADPGSSDQTIQVPKFYFKVLYEPIEKRGVAFVGINDPFVDVPYPDDYILCEDILDDISWLNIRDTTWLYACEVNDFLATVNTVPKLDVSGLLDD